MAQYACICTCNHFSPISKQTNHNKIFSPTLSYVSCALDLHSELHWALHNELHTYLEEDLQSFGGPMRKVKPRWRPLTSNRFEGLKQLLYHFPAITYLSVHKTIVLLFKSMSKCEILAHSLPIKIEGKLKELFDVSSSPLLFWFCLRG
jgi:hypothetical protein